MNGNQETEMVQRLLGVPHNLAVSILTFISYFNFERFNLNQETEMVWRLQGVTLELPHNLARAN